MKALIRAIAFSALFVATAVSASSLEQVDVYKYKDSVDRSFFESCQRNLEPHQGILRCQVFKAPEGLKILRDGGLIGSLSFIVNWSTSHCSLSKQAEGRLYLKTDSTSAYIYVEDEKCLEEIRDKVIEIDSKSFKNKALYLISKD